MMMRLICLFEVDTPRKSEALLTRGSALSLFVGLKESIKQDFLSVGNKLQVALM
jgi:hypothetical protein